MDNPNNAWVYNYPLPPGYAPPPPPPPKSSLTPPKGKSPGLALAMVCLMALAALAIAATNLLGTGNDLVDSMTAKPVYFAIAAADLLVTLLAFLKFVLPSWEPHRKTLGWLLGLSLLGTLAQTVYLVSQGAQIGASAAMGGFGNASATDFASAFAIVVGVISALVGIAMHPFFYLLLGVWTKKSMEKVAGVFAAVSLGSTLLFVPLGILLGSLTKGSFELPDTLWTSTIPALANGICAVIFYFSWPVLDRPVLEKTDMTSTNP